MSSRLWMILCAGAALIAVIASLSHNAAQRDCVLEQDGVSINLLYWAGRITIPYEQIERVDCLFFAKFLFSKLHLRCLLAGLWLIRRVPTRVVVLKRRGRRLFRYYVLTPADPPGFAAQLALRIAPTHGSGG